MYHSATIDTIDTCTRYRCGSIPNLSKDKHAEKTTQTIQGHSRPGGYLAKHKTKNSNYLRQLTDARATCVLVLLPPLNVGDGTLEGTSEISVEQRAVEPVNHCDTIWLLQLGHKTIGGGGRGAVSNVVRAGGGALSIPCPVLHKLILFNTLGNLGGGICAANFSHTEDWLPSVVEVYTWLGWVSESSTNQRPLRPAVVDAGEMPVNDLRGCVFVQLVAHVNKLLHRGDVDIVHGAEVEDNSFKSRFSGVVDLYLSTARSRVVPRTVS
jgi:hypothetical protein